MSKNVLVSLTGPSLTGKSNLAALLVEQGFVALVSSTTRPPRAEEVNGKHYNFLTREEFEQKLKEDGFIEHVQVGGNYYGVSRAEALKAFAAGKPAVVVCEPHGVKNIYEYAKNQGWTPFRVFLNNPVELLVTRFLERFKNDSKATADNYATRVINMLSKEQKEWVEPALNGTDAYELVLPEFGPKNQNEAVQLIADGVGCKKKAHFKP